MSQAPSHHPTTPAASHGVSLVKRSDHSAAKQIRNARLNNAYLQDGSKSLGMLRLLNIVAVVGLIVLMGLLTNFTASKTRILPTTSDDKMVTPPPVDQALDENIVSLWLIDAITQSTTMGFHDYHLRLKDIRSFYTDKGWDSFMRYMKSSHLGNPSLISRLDNDRLVIFGSPSLAPQILQRGLVNGVYTYIIRYVTQVKEVSKTGSAVPKLTFDLTVERVKSDTNPAGLAIAQWRIKIEN